MQSKYKAVRFSCKQRGPLLSALYQCMALAAADNLCPVAAKILGCGARALLGLFVVSFLVPAGHLWCLASTIVDVACE